jgi:hypothetical protein
MGEDNKLQRAPAEHSAFHLAEWTASPSDAER